MAHFWQDKSGKEERKDFSLRSNDNEILKRVQDDVEEDRWFAARDDKNMMAREIATLSSAKGGQAQ